MRVKVRKILIVSEGMANREYKTVDGGSRAVASQIARRLEKRYNKDNVDRNTFIRFAYDKAYRRVFPIVSDLLT